jgi:hypothetical protein
VALWTFFFMQLALLSLPYVVLYFLPYGFIKEKSFTQMPTHIIVIGNVCNFIVFSIPIVISIIMYIILTKEVQRRKSEQEPQIFLIQANTSNHPKRSSRQSSTNDSSDVGHFVEDLPYPLNTIQESDESEHKSSKQKTNQTIINNPSALPTRKESKSLSVHIKNMVSSKNNQSCAEIEAALRSMKTNLLMLLLFFINTLILFLPHPHWKVFVAGLFESLLKFLLPTITTVSNFGPVKEVVKIYMNNLKEKFFPHEQ